MKKNGGNIPHLEWLKRYYFTTNKNGVKISAVMLIINSCGCYINTFNSEFWYVEV